MNLRSRFVPSQRPRIRKPRKLQIEALEDRAVPAAPLVESLPDLALTSSQSVKLVPVTATDADGDQLTYSVKAAGTEAYFLSTQLGLKNQSTRRLNWGGQGEKWLQGNAGWYFITPTGSLHEWDRTDRSASGPQLASLPPVVFHYPDLLTRPRDTNLANILDRRLGLVPTSSPIANSLGLGERWMAGTGGARFYMTPTGELYRAGGSPLGSKSAFLVQLDPSYARDIQKLTNSTPYHLPVGMMGSVVRVGEMIKTPDEFVIQVSASDGSSAASTSFAVMAVAADSPVLNDPGPQVLGAGEQEVSVKLDASDPNGDPLTYTAQAAGSEAYFLATDLGLQSASRPINWGKERERWFVSAAGDFYFLKPSGDLHEWDGTSRSATGPQLATLPPVYFYYPDLLTRPSKQDLAYVLDQRLGLAPAANRAPNSLGLNEKWFSGKGTNFFITPEGGFYRQAGATTTWLADLGTGYYKTPNRLYAAPRDRFGATVAADSTLTITTRPNFLGQFAVRVTVSDGLNTTSSVIPVQQSDYVSPAAPRVVGAASSSNRTVTVSFSQPMNNTAADPANYTITTTGPGGGIAFLTVLGARFSSNDRTVVELTTMSQSDVTYTVAVTTVKDLGGTSLAPAGVVSGILIDPSKTTFGGRPPTLADMTDSDDDGLLDHEELRGWEVKVTSLNKVEAMRWVTSDPSEADSDGDGLSDAQEANLRLDPRDRDSDDDQLNDFAEFNEIFSDASKQDTDDDSLDDSLEFNFFRSSPVEKDTDGDQLDDNVEIVLGNRNARIADVPKPGIEVGSVDLQLDVRFTATSAQGTRLLDSKTESSTLTQSDKKELANTDANSNEFSTKVGVEQGWKIGVDTGAKGNFSVEAGYTGQWSSSFTETSAKETQQAVTETFQSDVEATNEETVQREVVGASMKVALSIKSLASIAFKIRNLQVTAFLQDPKQAGRLIPVATLLPDAGVPNEFILGPLVPERGPFIFASDQIFPALVQDLMINPRGLVFKVANYELTDEREKNFAFTSQDINDRTAPLVLDFGFGGVEAKLGVTTERYRLATSGGRLAVDTNGDGTLDDGDRPVVFDPNTGKAVGITVLDAMQMVGLTKYEEETTPTSSLSASQKSTSYSTKMVEGVERLWRVRGVSQESTSQLRKWTVFTAGGIDATTNFSDLVLKTEEGLTLKFLQDLDDDGIDAAQEYILGSSDSNLPIPTPDPNDDPTATQLKGYDTDLDGLSDAFEFFGQGPNPQDPDDNLIWTVDVLGKDLILGYSSPARSDSDLDGISDKDEFDRFVGPERRSLDARNPDTDGDGVTDYDEVNGYEIELRFPDPNEQAPYIRTSDPLNPDTDGDTLLDGDERTLGTDPTKDDLDDVLDNDGDGLVNFLEDAGWTVTTFGVSVTPYVQGTETEVSVTSSKNDADSDDDTLTDKEERDLGTNPNSADSDSDGVLDAAEVDFTVDSDGTRTFTLIYNPLDADTDDDKRSDGDERTIPINVRVEGLQPYDVFSDPTKADEDNDALVDSDEYTFHTDPKKSDTDGDNPGIGDGTERDIGTNPLKADQKIRITISKFSFLGDIDDGLNSDTTQDETFEMFGKVTINKSGESENEVKSYNDKAISDDHTEFRNDLFYDYILTAGDSIFLKINNFYDKDSVSGDDVFTDATKEFKYSVSPDNGNLQSRGDSDTGKGPDGQPGVIFQVDWSANVWTSNLPPA